MRASKFFKEGKFLDRKTLPYLFIVGWTNAVRLHKLNHLDNSCCGISFRDNVSKAHDVMDHIDEEDIDLVLEPVALPFRKIELPAYNEYFTEADAKNLFNRSLFTSILIASNYILADTEFPANVCVVNKDIAKLFFELEAKKECMVEMNCTIDEIESSSSEIPFLIGKIVSHIYLYVDPKMPNDDRRILIGNVGTKNKISHLENIEKRFLTFEIDDKTC